MNRNLGRIGVARLLALFVEEDLEEDRPAADHRASVTAEELDRNGRIEELGDHEAESGVEYRAEIAQAADMGERESHPVPVVGPRALGIVERDA